MIDYQMTVILNAALDLRRTPEGIEHFKNTVSAVLLQKAAEPPLQSYKLALGPIEREWDTPEEDEAWAHL